MPQMDAAKSVDINALKAQIDAEIAARLLVEADYLVRLPESKAWRIAMVGLCR